MMNAMSDPELIKTGDAKRRRYSDHAIRRLVKKNLVKVDEKGWVNALMEEVNG